MKPLSWGDGAFDVLAGADVRQVAYVPDAGLTRLIERCSDAPSMTTVSPASEQDAIGLALGAWLGGQRSAILMQSSGVGNCANALSMAQSCRLPLLMVVTMRGEWGEANPWQVPMGRATPQVLGAMGCIVHRLDDEADTRSTIKAAAGLAFEGLQMVAVLVGQRLIGTKAFVAADVTSAQAARP